MTILRTFVETKCPVCEGVKDANTVFCKRCYRELPIPMQRNLWKQFGSGFEKAFEEGYWFLKNRPDTKQQKLAL